MFTPPEVTIPEVQRNGPFTALVMATVPVGGTGLAAQLQPRLEDLAHQADGLLATREYLARIRVVSVSEPEVVPAECYRRIIPIAAAVATLTTQAANYLARHMLALDSVSPLYSLSESLGRMFNPTISMDRPAYFAGLVQIVDGAIAAVADELAALSGKARTDFDGAVGHGLPTIES